MVHKINKCDSQRIKMHEEIKIKLQEVKDTRHRIMKAARYLFSQYGYERPSLNEIANLSGIKKASLYHYINEKEDLLLNVLNRLTDQCNKNVFKKVICFDSTLQKRWSYFIGRIKKFYRHDYLPLSAIYLETKEKSIGIEKKIQHYYVLWVYEVTQIFKSSLGEIAAKRMAHRILAQLEGALALDSVFGNNHYQEQFYEDMEQQGHALFIVGGESRSEERKQGGA